MNVEEAYSVCERITTAEARNFAYGIKLLPRPKRQAMSALYALARRIDDIGDGDAAPPAKLDDLARMHADVATLARRDWPTADPVLIAMNDVARRYPIPLEALHDLIDGCEMDVNGTCYQTFDDLVVYCRKVAGTVGRLSLAIYGCSDPDRAPPSPTTWEWRCR